MLQFIDDFKIKETSEQENQIEELTSHAVELDTLLYLAYWRSLTARTPELVYHHLMSCINLHDWSLIDFREIGDFLQETRGTWQGRDLEYWHKIEHIYRTVLKKPDLEGWVKLGFASLLPVAALLLLK